MTGNKLDILVICSIDEAKVIFEEILLQELETWKIEDIKLHRNLIVHRGIIYGFIETPTTKYHLGYGTRQNYRRMRADQVFVDSSDLYKEDSRLYKMLRFVVSHSCVPEEFQFIDIKKLLEANKERYRNGIS